VQDQKELDINRSRVDTLAFIYVCAQKDDVSEITRLHSINTRSSMAPCVLLRVQFYLFPIKAGRIRIRTAPTTPWRSEPLELSAWAAPRTRMRLELGGSPLNCAIPVGSPSFAAPSHSTPLRLNPSTASA